MLLYWIKRANGTSGTTRSNSAVRGVSAELIGSILREILNEANVIFNNIINNQSQNISYSRATGEFTISATGNYYVLGG